MILAFILFVQSVSQSFFRLCVGRPNARVEAGPFDTSNCHLKRPKRDRQKNSGKHRKIRPTFTLFENFLQEDWLM